MPRLRIGSRGSLYYRVSGGGPSGLVLLHGSLSDHRSWDSVIPHLAADFRVLAYDRAGHSRSVMAAKLQDSILEDAEDLARIIEEVLGGPVHVAGSSGGAAIALRLAAGRPDLCLSLIAHEPPLLDTLPKEGEWGEETRRLAENREVFLQLMDRGDPEVATAHFVDSLSDGPGSWHSLPAAKRVIFVGNAWTLYHESLDPDFMKPDLEGLARFDRPVLLTQGARSAPFFAKIIDILIARSLSDAQRHTYPEAGHVPHESHPADYAATVRQFIRAQAGQ